MADLLGSAWQVLYWVGPPLLWVLLFKTFPDFIGGNLLRSLEARRLADLERLKGEIARRNGAEMEQLKSDLQMVSATVKTSADFLIANQSELRGRMIVAAESLWEDMLRLRDEFGQLIFIDSMLTDDEVSSFISGRNDDKGRFRFDEFRGLENSVQKLESGGNLGKARLFAGDRLWLIYTNYRTTIGRSNYLMGDSVEKRSLRPWHEDKHVAALLAAVLPAKAHTEVLSMKLGGLHTALGYMEAAFLREAARVMSGSTSFAEMMSDVQATLSIATNRLNGCDAPSRSG